MAELGTYSSGYIPWTPVNALPEPDDLITYDWLNAVSQYTQKYMKIATYVGTLVKNASVNFDYNSLGCDVHPPILESYVYDPTSGSWFDIIPDLSALGATSDSPGYYVFFKEIGLGTAVFVNGLTTGSRAFKLIAYL